MAKAAEEETQASAKRPHTAPPPGQTKVRGHGPAGRRVDKVATPRASCLGVAGAAKTPRGRPGLDRTVTSAERL